VRYEINFNVQFRTISDLKSTIQSLQYGNGTNTCCAIHLKQTCCSRHTNHSLCTNSQ